MLGRGDAAADGTEAGTASAVVLYDLAVDVAAKASLAERPPQTFPGTSAGYHGGIRALETTPPSETSDLPTVFDGLQASYRERIQDDNAELPARRDALLLHDFRNSVQHRGVVPSPTDLGRSRLRANTVFDALLQEFFGLAREELSRALLVVSERARSELTAAEADALQGDLDDAAGHALAALELLITDFRATVLRRRRASNVSNELTKRVDQLADSVSKRGLGSRYDGPADEAEELLGVLATRVQDLERAVELVTLGGDVIDARWVEDRFIAPIVIGLRSDPNPEVEIFRQESPVAVDE
ncbi:MAG: hypothetical protein QOJ29_1183, partial [Thermoleophilaceae bacterium]|nr:hypothetical protein [Thermoleophilaceae bacterium]